MKLGLIVRSDNTGLGNQTLELAKMLRPLKILIIDSSPFNGNKQHPEKFQEFNSTTVKGMLSNKDVIDFIKDIDVVMSCEIFYNKNFVEICRRRKVKTVLQYNFEFLDYLLSPNTLLPDLLLAPSEWRIEEVKEKFSGKTSIEFLPPPTDEDLFKKNVEENTNKTGNLLHIASKKAIHDRNGTNSVIEMLKYSKADYRLVIKTQFDLEIKVKDSRIAIETQDTDDHSEMYKGFDAMIMPRRYAGLCLPMNEALLSGLPVFMTDISPNNLILPKKWLARSEIIGNFMAKKSIDIYNADPKDLAKKIDQYFDASDKKLLKEEAFSLGYETFSQESLRQKYIDLIKSV
jgi:hypothetical protein